MPLLGCNNATPLDKKHYPKYDIIDIAINIIKSNIEGIKQF